jgi:hypothetical protein
VIGIPIIIVRPTRILIENLSSDDRNYQNVRHVLANKEGEISTKDYQRVLAIYIDNKISLGDSDSSG